MAARTRLPRKSSGGCIHFRAWLCCHLIRHASDQNKRTKHLLLGGGMVHFGLAVDSPTWPQVPGTHERDVPSTCLLMMKYDQKWSEQIILGEELDHSILAVDWTTPAIQNVRKVLFIDLHEKHNLRILVFGVEALLSKQLAIVISRKCDFQREAWKLFKVQSWGALSKIFNQNSLSSYSELMIFCCARIPSRTGKLDFQIQGQSDNSAWIL